MHELKHYGVLGMKWGVRRYQPYGSGGYNPSKIGRNIGEAALEAKRDNRREVLTKLNTQNIKGGKDKPNKSPAQVITKESENALRGAANILRAVKKKQPSKAKSMSDEELRKVINRLRLEQDYDKLTYHETKVDQVAKALDVIGDAAAVLASTAIITATVKSLRG